jgi:VanZ family protein
MSRPVLRAWVPALLWLLVIAWESTSVMSSANTGRFLFVVIRFFVPHITLSQLELLNAAGRKVGHCVGYAMLSLLMLRAWWSTLLLPRWAQKVPPLRAMLHSWSARAAALALLSTAAVAGLDEWHQMLLPGRTGTIHDVALDTMAAAAVQLIAIAFSDARGRQAALSS